MADSDMATLAERAMFLILANIETYLAMKTEEQILLKKYDADKDRMAALDPVVSPENKFTDKTMSEVLAAAREEFVAVTRLYDDDLTKLEDLSKKMNDHADELMQSIQLYNVMYYSHRFSNKILPRVSDTYKKNGWGSQFIRIHFPESKSTADVNKYTIGNFTFSVSITGI